MSFIDWATFLSFLAFNLDLLFEIRKVLFTRDSKDVSIPGIFIRLSASILILTKFIYIKDAYLIIGQGTFTMVLFVYFLLLLRYQPKKRKR